MRCMCRRCVYERCVYVRCVWEVCVCEVCMGGVYGRCVCVYLCRRTEVQSMWSKLFHIIFVYGVGVSHITV